MSQREVRKEHISEAPVPATRHLSNQIARPSLGMAHALRVAEIVTPELDAQSSRPAQIDTTRPDSYPSQRRKNIRGPAPAKELSGRSSPALYPECAHQFFSPSVPTTKID